VPNNARFISTTVGYGTGALLGRGIKACRRRLLLEELGLAQAVWCSTFEKYRSVPVESDLGGNSLFERENAKIAPGLEKALCRHQVGHAAPFGETDDKTKEVI